MIKGKLNYSFDLSSSIEFVLHAKPDAKLTSEGYLREQIPEILKSRQQQNRRV